VRPDLSATARVITDTRRQAVAIPIIALTVRENKPIATENQPRPRDTNKVTGKKRDTEGVFVVTKGVATFRPVKVGVAGDEYFEVLDGVREGEQIVAGPYQAIRDLHDGAHVRETKQRADTSRVKKAP
jgi:HlyD family secretion protein